jgi:nitrogen fixation protein FixH
MLFCVLAFADTNVGIVPATVHLTIEQGSTWSASLTFTDGNNQPIDLTPYIFKAQIRPAYSSTTVTATFTCTVTDAIHGVMTLSLTSDQTAALPAPFTGQWDLWMSTASPATALRVMAGNVTVVPRVTR